MICVWWLNDSKVLEKILKINTCTCIPYKLEFRDIVVHVCPGKVLKFAIKTFSKRRLFLYMIVHVYQNFFREIAKILLPPKPKELIRLSFQLTYSYNRQKARITYNGQRSTLKQKKNWKKKSRFMFSISVFWTLQNSQTGF